MICGRRVKELDDIFACFGSAYGVVDSAQAPTFTSIKAYVEVFSDFKSSQFEISDINKYGLGLTLACSKCKHETNVTPREIHSRYDACLARDVTGKCKKCGTSGIDRQCKHKRSIRKDC